MFLQSQDRPRSQPVTGAFPEPFVPPVWEVLRWAAAAGGPAASLPGIRGQVARIDQMLALDRACHWAARERDFAFGELEAIGDEEEDDAAWEDAARVRHAWEDLRRVCHATHSLAVALHQRADAAIGDALADGRIPL